MEVSENDTKNSISGNSVIIIAVVVVAASICMWKRSIVSRWMPFFWSCIICMTSCMVPRVFVALYLFYILYSVLMFGYLI